MLDNHTDLSESKEQLAFHIANKGAKRPDLSMYTDFRDYLNDFYKFKIETSSSMVRAYSYATFSASANIKSPNYLKLIIEAKRNLSEDMIIKFARALELNKEQASELRALVLFNQAKEPLLRNQYLKVLAEIRVKAKIKNGEIEAKKYKQIPSWVSYALYALLDQQGVEFTVDVLFERLKSKATKDEIKSCLSKLEENGQIEFNEDTKVYQKIKGASKEETLPVALVRKLQSEFIYLGLESLFEDQTSDREFGALTMSLTKDEYQKLMFEVRHFRKKIYKDYLLKRESSKGEKLYQLNLQLFGMSK